MKVDYVFLKSLLNEMQACESFMIKTDELIGFLYSDAKYSSETEFMEKLYGHIFLLSDIGAVESRRGNKSMGLAHIIKRRREKGQDSDNVLNSLENVIADGKLLFNKVAERFEISNGKIKAIVSPSFKNERLQFLVNGV